jgi:alkanesulfonate monooxygenase SsuD/methylene tetrahydromethanopterin reductase-like flavin-dependent oxidoreductase (luciferase family)
MKFQLAINLERMSPDTDINEVRDHTLAMVKMADQAGFEIVWAAEHHALEMTIAPNPFQLLTWWAGHTQHIRLGSGVANAAYWHPIRIAGEAAMLDLVSGGRLEFGLGSGAYQREFDRMHPDLEQKEGYRYLQEMLPLVQQLWQGDVTHDGALWQFPASTSCPKPLQSSVPIWVAARSPITFDYAVENNCNIMSWPLTMPFSEVEKYRGLLDESVAKANGKWSGQLAMMRHTSVYETESARGAALNATTHVLGQFGNLMMKKGDVVNGFPDRVPFEQLEGILRVDTDALETNLMFGTPDQIVQKLGMYADIGADAFIYYASMGLGMAEQRRSMELFIDKVMPHFSATSLPAAAAN